MREEQPGGSSILTWVLLIVGGVVGSFVLAGLFLAVYFKLSR